MKKTNAAVSLIWAMAKNRVIGNHNTLPWHLPADLRHFRDTTTGHCIIMGRKNYESIGRPLPNRNNIILTNNPSFEAAGCIVVHCIEQALQQCREEEIFIIGGAEIYRLFLPLAQRLYITEIDAEADGDTFFPEYDTQEWQETERRSYHSDEKNPYSYSFVKYQRTGA